MESFSLHWYTSHKYCLIVAFWHVIYYQNYFVLLLLNQSIVFTLYNTMCNLICILNLLHHELLKLAMFADFGVITSKFTLHE